MAMIFKTQYSAQVPKKGIVFTDKSRTQQEFKDECNINVIMERYMATGIINHTSEYQPVFADVTAFQGDLQAAYDMIDRADAAFNALPSGLRAELNNNPRNLFAFISNPANKQKCIDYGIFNKPEFVSDPVVVNPKSEVKTE